LQLVNAREKAFRPQWEFFFPKKIPSLSLSHSRGSRGDGILNFQNNLARACSCAWFGVPRLRGRPPEGGTPNNAKRRSSRCAALAAALQICAIVALASLLTACSRTPPGNSGASPQTHEVTDEAGRRLRLPDKIDRVVSLAPNLTEIVFAVGAGNRLVGRTRYCDYPAEAKGAAEVGDTLKPSVERIIALKPQVVLVSTASQLEAFTKQLDAQNISVYVTNPQSLDDVFRSIQTLGDLFGEHERSAGLVATLRKRAEAVTAATSQVKPARVFYQVSGEPLYTIGRDAYLTDLIRRAGGVSVTADVPGAFPRFSDEAALASRPEAIILPSGGSMGSANSTVAAPLKNSPAVLNNRVYKINDDHLSRPGPRLVDGLEEMARALHPEAFK
jgi:iron complex transport system substrate-binding protein